IYYGDEIGLPGGFDPDCRRSFPWQAPETWDHDLLAYVSAASALRHANPVLRHGTFRILGAEGQAVAYLRGDDATAIVVAVNAGAEPARLAVDLPAVAGRSLAEVPLPGGNPGSAVALSNGRAWIEIPARAGRVLRVEA
ncbi:MAG TPA: DUF3459 domain-containing protein, partial [Patescibacteria group bacterium]|nr:DUF3459 domain-containing protein [Patescibacteria group bacterium]